MQSQLRRALPGRCPAAAVSPSPPPPAAVPAAAAAAPAAAAGHARPGPLVPPIKTFPHRPGAAWSAPQSVPAAPSATPRAGCAGRAEQRGRRGRGRQGRRAAYSQHRVGRIYTCTNPVAPGFLLTSSSPVRQAKSTLPRCGLAAPGACVSRVAGAALPPGPSANAAAHQQAAPAPPTPTNTTRSAPHGSGRRYCLQRHWGSSNPAPQEKSTTKEQPPAPTWQ